MAATTATDEISEGKQRRSSRACIQCRARKQRCLPELPGIPCKRCQTTRKACSFELDVVEDYREATRYTPYSETVCYASEIRKMQQQLMQQQRRIEALERGGNSDASGSSIRGPDDYSCDKSSPLTQCSSTDLPPTDIARPSKRFRIETVAFGAPITTLRNLTTLSDAGVEDPSPGSPSDAQRSSTSHLDPVDKGIITMQEADRLFTIFFENCHQLAPLLCARSQSSASFVRSTSKVLFTSMCTVASRYWDCDRLPQSSRNWLHPRYFDLVSLLDENITTLLLKSTPSDINLEAVQALLVYLQWMPLEASNLNAPLPHQHRSRFNDVSAWSITGLAIRQALFMGLDRSVEAPFTSQERGAITEYDMRRMRVWLNLLSIDHHLMLTAGLPASLDPEPATRVARAFGSHPLAQPCDIKAAALCELVYVLNRASRFCGDPSLRRLDPVSLKRANNELDEWESTWTVVLPKQSTLLMPFTALRWYRLALNSVSLGAALARHPGNSLSSPEPTPAALEISIEAAAQMLFHFSTEVTMLPPDRSFRMIPVPFTVNEQMLASFQFAIDSYWITHAFAIVFLALAYTRAIIDDDLNVIRRPDGQVLHPMPVLAAPREVSLLYRLSRLAVDTFSSICTSSASHSAAHYRNIVEDTFEALIQHGSGVEVLFSDVENMFPGLLDLGFDWNLFHEGTFGILPST